MNKFIDKFGSFPHELLFNEGNLLNISEYSNTIVLDLFDVLISIVYHDFFTSRTEGFKTVELSVPIQNYSLFMEIQTDINKLVSFMTGVEEWEVNFIESETEKSIECERKVPLLPHQFNSIALISAGLDSMGGVSKEIHSSNKTLFVNSYSKSESKKLTEIYDAYEELKNSKIITVHKYPMLRDGEVTIHANQRTRTLAFIANTLVYSDYYNIRDVKLYENGIMSLNPSFDSRRGVTKTTHHKTIFMLNEILRKLGINTYLTNPFKYMTKKDVIKSIDDDLKLKIKDTRTCSKGNVIQFNRDNRNKGSHCGGCIACILRLIGLHDLSIPDVVYKIPKYSMHRDTSLDSDINFSYHEKKSLIEYYKRFKQEIESGKIYDYLDGMQSKYFNDDLEFIDKIENMLNRFSLEISSYLSKITYD